LHGSRGAEGEGWTLSPNTTLVPDGLEPSTGPRRTDALPIGIAGTSTYNLRFMGVAL